MGPPCAMGPQIIETHTPPIMGQRRSAETMDTAVMGEDLFMDERQTVKRPRSRACVAIPGKYLLRLGTRADGDLRFEIHAPLSPTPCTVLCTDDSHGALCHSYGRERGVLTRST